METLKLQTATAPSAARPAAARPAAAAASAAAPTVRHERPRPAEELVSLRAPHSPEAEQYRSLRETIERQRRDTGLRVVAITSAGPGEGKTVTSVNLAGALAQSAGSRVLLVDADLHRPAVARYLGLTDERALGFADVLADSKCALATAVRRLESVNVSVLLPGRTHPRPYELLASSRLEQVLVDMRDQYDYVVIDTPPVLPVADCRVLGRWVDGFLLVVAAHQTTRKMLGEAIRLIDATKLMGVVFNGDDRPRRSYYGYYGS
jgi:capsular exopolysaccharide synthesis family protein